MKPHCIGVIACGEFAGVGLCKALSAALNCDASLIASTGRVADFSVAVIDLGADADTVDEVRRFRAANPGVAILAVLNDPASVSTVAQLPDFVPIRRSATIRDAQAAIRMLQPAFQARPVADPAADRARLRGLSRRELELLPLLADGMTLQAAAERLGITYKTADSYRSNMLRKLGLRDRIQLARFAIREGVIQA